MKLWFLSFHFLLLDQFLTVPTGTRTGLWVNDAASLTRACSWAGGDTAFMVGHPAGARGPRALPPVCPYRPCQLCRCVPPVATSLPPPLPLLALKDGTFYSIPRGEPLRFPGCDDGFVIASGNWLVYNRLHCLLLVDPFSGATMTLPAPRSISVSYDGDDGDEPYSSMDFVVIKLIVCSPDLIAALFQGGRKFWIAVCRPGASSWSVARKLPMWIFDIAFYQEKLYAVSYVQDLLALDISVDDNTGDPQVAHIRHVLRGGYIHLDENFQMALCLIESRGSLLMVRRRIFHGHIHGEGQIHPFAEQCEPELAVFEADFERSRWALVTTLGDDQALFLGPCSRAVCMPQCDMQNSACGSWMITRGMLNLTAARVLALINDMAIRKFSCPLKMISSRGHNGCAGAVWLFPSN